MQKQKITSSVKPETILQSKIESFPWETSMQKQKITSSVKPETILQRKIESYLRERGWVVMPTTGNLYQRGFPDLYIFQRKYGPRWVEVKMPVKWKFTPAQWEFFPKMIAGGIGIWIMTAANKKEYDKLMHKSNLWVYMGGYEK
jgi:hypothetical protein